MTTTQTRVSFSSPLYKSFLADAESVEPPSSPYEASPLDRNCARPGTAPAGTPPVPTIAEPYPQITHAGLKKVDHPNKPYGFHGGQNLLQAMENDIYSNLRHENLYYPFRSEEEWQLARWISESRLTQAQIDKFLKLDQVRKYLQVYFLDAHYSGRSDVFLLHFPLQVTSAIV